MKTGAKIVLIILVSIFSLYIFFKEEIDFNFKKQFLNPCSSPIQYTIGSIDSQFDLEKEYLISIIKQSAEEWNLAMDKKLFEYSDNSGIKINFIYDYRQDTTEKIDDIDSTYQEKLDRYYDLDAEYKEDINIYNIKKEEIDNLISLYNKKANEYEKDVDLWNKSQKNSSKEYNRLNNEKEELDKMLLEIENKKIVINNLSNDINYLVNRINRLSVDLNINVNEYNETISKLENNFEQGSYIKGFGLKEINIYQFKDEDSLKQVLIHEFGHALGLDHFTNPEDIMYWINTENEQFITESSLDSLKIICYE
ncbi:MAG: matrixin family metalloprotease [Candidatus Pacebacteria bacterium]|nr:matrixin family metalloprotease [Candidatus Paceibacterota bacterium]